MRRFAWMVLALALGIAAVTIVATSGELPVRVASHFDGQGMPDGWMTRGFYTAFMLALAVGLPLLMVASVAVAARLAPNRLNVPNRGYWSAPERRAEAIGKITASACWLGAFVAIFILGLHFLLIEANAGSAQRLPNAAFYGLLGGFVAGLVVWIVALYAQFRRPVL